jgi:hypothetical protein
VSRLYINYVVSFDKQLSAFLGPCNFWINLPFIRILGRHICHNHFYCLHLLYNQPITTLSVQLTQFNLKPYTIQYMSCTAISQWIFSDHMFTYLWKDIYENLVVKSVGLNLFSLLGSSSSSGLDVSSFGCVVILSLYLTLNFVISSLIVVTFKSVTLC